MKKSHLFGYCVFLTVGFGAMQFNSCSTAKKTKPCIECPKFSQTVDSLKQRINTDSVTIDLMEHEMKRLEQENQVFGSMLVDGELVRAMIQVESRGDDSAYCAKEEAVGCLQIRPIMLKEINRILKRQGSNKAYESVDRWSRDKSVEMLKVFADYYELKSAEDVARCWNGGPKGMNYSSTEGYWDKVQNEMI